MSVTRRDYDRALERFVESVRRLGADLESVMIHGSLACGTVQPGWSDIMDAHLVLRDGVLEDRRAFERSLEVMLETCDDLAGRGIPFHPFGYLARGELGYLHVAPFSIYPFEPFSRVVHGEDVLPEIEESAASRELGRTYFFEARSAAHFHLARYLGRPELSEADCAQLVSVLTTVRKSLAMACVALGMSVTEIDKNGVVRQLEELAPGLDTAVIDEIDALRGYLEPVAGEAPIGKQGRGRASEETRQHGDEIRRVARRAALFLEQLHDEIRRRWEAEAGAACAAGAGGEGR